MSPEVQVHEKRLQHWTGLHPGRSNSACPVRIDQERRRRRLHRLGPSSRYVSQAGSKVPRALQAVPSFEGHEADKL